LSVFSKMRVSLFPVVSQPLGAIGRSFLEMVNEGFRMVGFLYIIFSVAWQYRKDGRKVVFQDVISQIYFTGVQSMPLVFVVALLMGGLLIIQSAEYITSVGEEFFGTLVNVIIIRELGSLLTAIIVLLRSGAAVATEMGYMAVLKETKGIEMMGINPVHYLAIPRMIGISISMICLFVCFSIISILGGMLLTWMITNIEMTNLIKELSQSIGTIDLFVGMTKSLFFGIFVSLVSLYHGFNAAGALTSIPPRVSRAMVEGLILCISFSVMISALFYL
jgi:phospholipid/cholesterol/gamma-HCH transport system permease protein